MLLIKESQKQLETLDDEDEDFGIMMKTSDFVNSFGPQRKTPLHFAIEGNSLPCVKALVE